MSAKKIFISRFILSVSFFCAAAGTAYYVSHHYIHHRTGMVAIVNPKTSENNKVFTDKLGAKLAAATNYNPSARRPVIFDNDAAADDFMALMLIGNDPRLDIKAITVAGTGEAHGENGARNMADAAYLLGKPTLPIAFGRGAPLSPAGVMFPDEQRKHVDHLLDNIRISHHPAPTVSADAVGLMHDVLLSSKDKVSILATGPLTNVAELIQKYPQLRHKIERIYVMGGAINVPGNLQALAPDNPNNKSEWNFFADPEAVKIVFHSRVPVTLVALDATNQVKLNKGFYQQLAKQKQPALKFVYALHKGLVDRFGMKAYENDLYMWDALAAMTMLEPDSVVLGPMALNVDLHDGSIRPTTVGIDAAIIDVVTTIPNPDSVLKKYIATIESNHIYAQQKFHDAVWHRTA